MKLCEDKKTGWLRSVSLQQPTGQQIMLVQENMQKLGNTRINVAHVTLRGLSLYILNSLAPGTCVGCESGLCKTEEFWIWNLPQTKGF